MQPTRIQPCPAAPQRPQTDAALRRLAPRIQRVPQPQRRVQQQRQLRAAAQLVQRGHNAAQRACHLSCPLRQAALELQDLRGRTRREACAGGLH